LGGKIVKTEKEEYRPEEAFRDWNGKFSRTGKEDYRTEETFR